MLLEGALATLALLAALALRPWRALGPSGPPWPWLAWWAVLPLLWSGDRLAASDLAPAISGACLLMLMAGWPLAMLALAPTTLIVAWWVGLGGAEALSRAVWLGVVPATLAMALGGAIRRWLPNHLFVYILGRGFFATAIAGTAAGVAQVLRQGAPTGLVDGDAMLARLLAAWGDAFLTGMFVAIFVAFRPEWLATYADRIWLVPGPRR